MLPAAFVLPRGPALDRERQARPPGAAGAGGGEHAASRDRRPPRTPLERALVRAVPGGPGAAAEREIGIDDDFFDLGGHSLLATQLVSRVREDLPGRAAAARRSSRHPRSPAWRHGSSGLGRPREAPVAPPLARVPAIARCRSPSRRSGSGSCDQLAPESPAYNLAAAMRLAGPLDADVLAAALREILRRHEALRTTFRATASGAVQEIHPAAPCRMPRGRPLRPPGRGPGGGGEADRRGGGGPALRSRARAAAAGRSCCVWRPRSTWLLWSTAPHRRGRLVAGRVFVPRARPVSTRRRLPGPALATPRAAGPVCRFRASGSGSGCGGGAGGAARLLAGAACRRSAPLELPADRPRPRGPAPAAAAAISGGCRPRLAEVLSALGPRRGRDALHGPVRRFRAAPAASLARPARPCCRWGCRSPTARGARSRA